MGGVFNSDGIKYVLPVDQSEIGQVTSVVRKVKLIGQEIGGLSANPEQHSLLMKNWHRRHSDGSEIQ